ncbi:MAG: hypothetical protein II813_02770 [Spirochaetales bacterium]|nr:hypothetical protein [Spirochaetales bacterium]MBQ4500607.1 hypothetical protein [Spirochaetales bacterium]MBQ7282341.1 hypothetical protein [Spirochaetales bacterium]
MQDVLQKLFRYMTDPDFRTSVNITHGFYKNMSDERFLRMLYKRQTGRQLDIERPKTFNEKIQWLKLHDHNPKYHVMADKIASKEYVASIIGEKHIIKTLGVWDHFDDIDFKGLPDRFVLKCNHNSGALFIVKDIRSFDAASARNLVEDSLRHDYYEFYREWAYKDIERKVFAEEYIDAGENGLTDYKFFCFDGIPRFINVSRFEHTDDEEISFFTLDWKLAPFQRTDHKLLSITPERPRKLDEMIEIASALSKGVPFLRVDLYEVGDTVYFGELTFYPTGGFASYGPEPWNERLGSWISLPS